MCQPQYESSVADADILISAKVIKVIKLPLIPQQASTFIAHQAKFKLEDVVRETLCLEEVPRKQCMDINIQVGTAVTKTTLEFFVDRNSVFRQSFAGFPDSA